MTLFLSWIAFPLVAAALALGCGLLVELLSGRRLPGVLLIPLGLALVIVVADLTTATHATAQLATPLVVALAFAGLALSFPTWRERRPNGWALVAALGAFAVYAAPTVLTGSATFAGYLTLDDTATWLAFADRAIEDGRTLSGLAPSTYQQVLTDYFQNGYPLGAFAPLGLSGKLVGQDIAWLFQPLIAVFAAALALSIYSLCGDLVRSRPLRAGVALIGAQPALLFAYASWSGLKEVCAAFLLALVTALIVATLRGNWPARGAVPITVAVAALLAVLSLAGAVWLIVPGLVVLAIFYRHDLRACVWRIPLIVGAIAVLSLPSLVLARSFISGATNGPVTGANEVANLGHPLHIQQMLGIWPSADFRNSPGHAPLVYALMAVLGVAAAYGVVRAWRTRALAVPLYLATSAAGALLVLALAKVGWSSPWLNAKAMAEASPGFVVAGLAGAGAAVAAHRRLMGAVAGVAVAGGVLWSTALIYHGAWLAPRDQLAELQRIGNTYPGAGPTLMTEYQTYGARHFLRRMDPETVSERRRRVVPLRTGNPVPTGGTADLDALALDGLLEYRTFVLRTSPNGSRPPSLYTLLARDRWYEVWQRPQVLSNILEHLSLGEGLATSAVPDCADILRLGRLAAAAGGTLAVSRRPNPLVVRLESATIPTGWRPDALSATVVPSGTGVLEADIEIQQTGQYKLWLGGSFRRTVTFAVDGVPAGAITHHLNNDGQYTPFREIALLPGPHRVSLRYDGSSLSPGSGGPQLGMGPILLAPVSLGGDDVASVQPAQARSLCGQSLDWVEAVGG